MLERPSLAEGLAALQARRPEARSTSTAEPIFIFAAGWRSGSTLLQRLLMKHCWMWGEPYGHAGLVDSLTDVFRSFTPQWPERHFFRPGETAEALTEKFIANTYPPLEDLLAAHRNYFETLLGKPARRAGATRWGMKEVRLGIDHALYFRWLFPKAKFLFLHRNPYDAWRSFAARRDAGWKWFDRWPDRPLTAQRYGSRWRELVAGFLKGSTAVDGLVVRYDELSAGRLERIEQYLGLSLDRSILKSNPSDGGPRPVERIAEDELNILNTEMQPLATALGYPPPAGSSPGLPLPGSPGLPLPGSPGLPVFENFVNIVAPSVPAKTVVPAVAPSGPANTAGTVSAAAVRDVSSAEPPTAKNDDAAHHGDKKSPRCVVLVPVAHHIEPDCDHALRELERRGYEVRRVYGFAAIDQGRCRMATDAVTAGFDELLWIDSDVAFDPDSVERLRANPAPIIAGVYAKKGRRAFACNFPRDTKEIRFGRQGAPIPVDHIGFGFVLTRRIVYDTMRVRLNLPACNREFGEAMIPYFQPMTVPVGDEHRYLAEDYAFCERARQCGFSVLVDTSIRLWHVGKYRYGWEDAGSETRRFPDYRFRIR